MQLLQLLKPRPLSGRSPWYWAGLAAIILGAASLGHLKTLGSLAFDFHDQTCLNWTVYVVKPFSGVVRRDALVAFISPKMAEATHDEVGHVVRGKIVRGLPGDRIDIKSHVVSINGKDVDRLYLCDDRHRDDYCADRSYTIRENEFFVMGTHRLSFDSRYWGTIRKDEIVGDVEPLALMIERMISI